MDEPEIPLEPSAPRLIDEHQALLAISLVARRASIWAHDILCNRPISDGKISVDTAERFKKDILEALSILDRQS